MIIIYMKNTKIRRIFSKEISSFKEKLNLQKIE